MTRETDSSSSGPQGRGGAAYPSGTPPYGSRPFPSLHPQERTRPPGAPDDGAQEAAEAAAPPADEPRTETTLTTRIRINIPGSRPIPPVVVRTTVDDGAAAAAEAAAQTAAEPEPEAPAEPEPEKTSDWFAPRKSAPASPPPAAPPAASPYGHEESTGGMPLPPSATGCARRAARDALRRRRPRLRPRGGGGDRTAAGAQPRWQQGRDAGRHVHARVALRRRAGRAAGRRGAVPAAAGRLRTREGEAARGPHDTPAGGFAVPFANEAPPFGAGSPFDTGSTPQEAPPFGAGSPFDTAAMPAVDDSPYDTGSQPFGTGAVPAAGDAASGFDTGSPAFGTGPRPAAGDARSPYDTGSQPFRAGAVPGAGDAGSPYDTGSQPFGTGAVPAGDAAFYDTSSPAFGTGTGDGASPYDTGSQPFGTADFPPGVPRPSEPSFPGGEDAPNAPFGPTTGGTGSMKVPPVTPEAAGPPAGPNGFRPPAPAPRGDGPGASGDTLVSGIPTVPSGAARGPRQAPPRAAAPAPVPAPARSEPAEKPAAAKAAKPAKKGRSKPVLLGVAVGGVLVVAYGAGLLMNHADVPKGTTVLGTDIGNQNRETAVKMLDTALGDRATAPIHLTIGGKKQTLKPSVAGLAIDTDATVRQVAHADYNPVSVIGSLFGGSRTADPVFVMDEDKLKAALQTLAGTGGGGTDAMVRFEDHKAIGVPGTPRRTLDLVAATAQVEAAYRTRAETGTDAVVVLNAATAAPKVSQAELDKAVNGFGKAAMSGKVTVRADAAHTIDFNKTVPQFLTMVATPDGKLAPHIDLDTLKGLYGAKFDQVRIKRADGSKTAVTPDDVAKALIKALGATDPADRTVTLDNVV
ncbi:hypothetical protein [Actinacidiphila bryophytorum]|uniref:hypothetical protein n=1 Tax=Actinacidiphila bryophytorum TaxID=1436133 RepID=UPI002176E164|nr:hypothetical protein [Actinacidiphila bryophytorum]UWE12418.1 hypothetical protein NYE86_29520 [Actinacidiphila bryophytorum]